jgi:hypothetical protein
VIPAVDVEMPGPVCSRREMISLGVPDICSTFASRDFGI